MRILFTAAVTGAILAAAPALAWSGADMTQPASNDMLIYAYPSKANYCPAGLQPISMGGVICCGTPNAAYESHAPRRVKRVSHTPTVVYEKGQ